MVLKFKNAYYYRNNPEDTISPIYVDYNVYSGFMYVRGGNDYYLLKSPDFYKSFNYITNLSAIKTVYVDPNSKIPRIDVRNKFSTKRDPAKADAVVVDFKYDERYIYKFYLFVNKKSGRCYYVRSYDSNSYTFVPGETFKQITNIDINNDNVCKEIVNDFNKAIFVETVYMQRESSNTALYYTTPNINFILSRDIINESNTVVSKEQLNTIISYINSESRETADLGINMLATTNYTAFPYTVDNILKFYYKFNNFPNNNAVKNMIALVRDMVDKNAVITNLDYEYVTRVVEDNIKLSLDQVKKDLNFKYKNIAKIDIAPNFKIDKK